MMLNSKMMICNIPDRTTLKLSRHYIGFSASTVSHHLEIDYYVNFLGCLGSNGFQLKWQSKNSKSWALFWSYQIKSTANSAHFAHFLGKWDELAVLFSWVAPKWPQNFDFFNYHECRLFIWGKKYWDLGARIFYT